MSPCLWSQPWSTTCLSTNTSDSLREMSEPLANSLCDDMRKSASVSGTRTSALFLRCVTTCRDDSRHEKRFEPIARCVACASSSVWSTGTSSLSSSQLSSSSSLSSSSCPRITSSSLSEPPASSTGMSSRSRWTWLRVRVTGVLTTVAVVVVVVAAGAAAAGATEGGLLETDAVRIGVWSTGERADAFAGAGLSAGRFGTAIGTLVGKTCGRAPLRCGRVLKSGSSSMRNALKPTLDVDVAIAVESDALLLRLLLPRLRDAMASDLRAARGAERDRRARGSGEHAQTHAGATHASTRSINRSSDRLLLCFRTSCLLRCIAIGKMLAYKKQVTSAFLQSVLKM